MADDRWNSYEEIFPIIIDDRSVGLIRLFLMIDYEILADSQHYVIIMCGSRKYPYPPHGGFFQFDPPTPLDFPFQRVWPYSPPPPGNSTILPLDPLPPGKSISTNKNEIRVIYIYFITIYLKCQNVLYKWTKTFSVAQFLRYVKLNINIWFAHVTRSILIILLSYI